MYIVGVPIQERKKRDVHFHQTHKQDIAPTTNSAKLASRKFIPYAVDKHLNNCKHVFSNASDKMLSPQQKGSTIIEPWTKDSRIAGYSTSSGTLSRLHEGIPKSSITFKHFKQPRLDNETQAWLRDILKHLNITSYSESSHCLHLNSNNVLDGSKDLTLSNNIVSQRSEDNVLNSYSTPERSENTVLNNNGIVSKENHIFDVMVSNKATRSQSVGMLQYGTRKDFGILHVLEESFDHSNIRRNKHRHKRASK